MAKESGRAEPLVDLTKDSDDEEKVAGAPLHPPTSTRAQTHGAASHGTLSASGITQPVVDSFAGFGTQVQQQGGTNALNPFEKWSRKNFNPKNTSPLMYARVTSALTLAGVNQPLLRGAKTLGAQEALDTQPENHLQAGDEGLYVCLRSCVNVCSRARTTHGADEWRGVEQVSDCSVV